MSKLSSLALAALVVAMPLTATADPAPHLYLQIDNRGDTDATVRFINDSGNVVLNPALPDAQPIPAHTSGGKYGVYFNNIDPLPKFSIAFKGLVAECAVTLNTYLPANPEVDIKGPGCQGAGYEVSGNTLILYITKVR